MNIATVASPFQPKKIKRISFETFYKKYGQGTPGFKYEWNNGIIEKTTSMKQDEKFIIANLLDRFNELGLFKNGHLLQELEVWTSKTQFRKPDMAYYEKKQTSKSESNVNSIPRFVIEVISTYDPINIVTNKVLEYFQAGVQVVWHIFPEQKLVYIFTSPKLITVCEGEDICSAAPALPDFKIAAGAIFQ